MKPWIFTSCAVFGALSLPNSNAQTLEWGPADGKALIDSDGDAINDSFVFELGAFALDFNPNESNVGQWFTHWKVFDRLMYDTTFGFSISSISILNNVQSEISVVADPAFSFSGQDAYIWIRNGNDPVVDTEWFVGRAENWTFPVTGGDCCAADFITWPSSDLTSSDVPVWGWQNEKLTPTGTGINGEYTQRGFEARSIVGPETDRTPAIQTLTFIPEPSSALLTFIAGIGLLLRHRRSA